MPRQNSKTKDKRRLARTATRRAKSVAKRTKTAVKRMKRATQRKASSARKRTARPARAAHPDAISLLRHDHRELLPMLEALHEAPVGRRERLLERVEQALKTHTRIEEEIFYPAFRDVAVTEEDRRMFHESLEEHHAADVILREVSAALNHNDAFGGRAKVLAEIVRHHADEEEREMFPRARRLFPSAELKRLGDEMQMRKRALAPSTGPLAAVASLFSR